MQYISIKRFKRDGIDGRFNIPYGAVLELNDEGILEYQSRAVCVSRSAAAHKHFACNYDGRGLERGGLTRSILDCLEPQEGETREEHNARWQNIWNDKLAQKYRRREHVTHWLWSDDFFNASIEDLEHIAKLARSENDVQNH